MADVNIRRIERNADTAQTVEYLDYLAQTLTFILENIDEQNLSDEIMKKIRR